MPTALIKITQGATTDIPGRALKGSINGVPVVFSNGDDTGVVSWKYELLDVPPPSAIPLSVQGPGVLSTFTMTAPDAPGAYRVRLTVWDAAGIPDVDIRNFAVPFPVRSLIAPPYQANPPPLALTGVGAKPDELNFGGQLRGWAGDDNAGRRLMYQLVRDFDQLGVVAYYGSPYTTNDGSTYTIAGYGTSPSTNVEVHAHVQCKSTALNNHSIMWRRAAFRVDGSNNISQIGTTQTPAADLATSGGAAWASTLDTDGTTIRVRGSGAAVTLVEWTVRLQVWESYTY